MDRSASRYQGERYHRFNLFLPVQASRRFNDITAVPVIKQNAEIITGHSFGAGESDEELFSNDYLEQVEERDEILDEQARENAAKENDRR